MTFPVQAPTTMDIRNVIAKSIHCHTRAINRLLNKARAVGIRVALKVETVVEADGTYWDIGVYGSDSDDRSVIVERAKRLRAIKIKQI